MQRKFKTSLFAALIVVFASNASEAAEKGSAAPAMDVDKLCFSVAEACLDACSKAAMTVTESTQCNNNCGDAMRSCLGQTASQGSAATLKDQIRPKRKTKKYVPSN